MDRSRSIVGALLATSSVVAMIAADAGPAYAVCSTIGSGFNNNNTMITCATATNAIITGNVVNGNAGAITTGGAFGIKLKGGTLNGAIINSGTISVLSGSGSANGVWIQGAIVTGGIDATPSFGGGVTNSGHLASASASGIQVRPGRDRARPARQPKAKLGRSYSGELAGRLQDHSVKGNFT
jgi:hypothetical protein